MICSEPSQKNKSYSEEYQQYLKSIAKYPLLTAGEEKELAFRIKDGSNAAFNRLINCNLRLVVNIANKYKYDGVDIFDLVQAGNVGLTEAAKRFDPSLGFRFSSYAYSWIKKECVCYLAEMRYPISLSPALYNALGKVVSSAGKVLGESVDDMAHCDVKKLSSASGVPARTISRVVTVCSPFISIDACIGEDENMHAGDVIPDIDGRTPEEDVVVKEMCGYVRELVETLPPEHAAVIRNRFGLNDGVTKTLRQLGQEMGCSRENVRVKETKALRLLRKEVNNNEKYHI